MLERLADYDDALMEQLISDIEPPRDRVFDDLARELREGHVVPLLMGSATAGHGVTRLLKALRHEAPGVDADARAARRRGRRGRRSPRSCAPSTPRMAANCRWRACCAAPSPTARRSSVRAASEERIAGVARLIGAVSSKLPRAEEGDTVAFARLESLVDRRPLQPTARSRPKRPRWSRRRPPTQAFAIHVKDRKDEVRLAAALAKLCEEDPSLAYVQDQESGELKLMGQGEMHLRVITERLAERFGVAVEATKPSVAYRETIRDGVTVRGRHKKQSGGHGQFGDVLVEVGPRERGEGFAFSERVHGGTVPRQYFSSVEMGARDALTRGPLGFPVVDVAVDADRRLLSHRRFLRHGVSRRGQGRARRGVAQGPARAARAHSRGDDLRALRRAGARQRPGQRAARANPRLRGAQGLGRLGGVARADPRGGNRRPHRRTALRHRRASAPSRPSSTTSRNCRAARPTR